MRACWFLVVAACGGGGESPQDAAVVIPDVPEVVVIVDAALPDNPGFVTPTQALKANVEQSPNSWIEVGPADLTCLGTPSADQATTVPVALATTVRDFQSDNAVPGATVNVFPDALVASPFDSAVSDANGNLGVELPIGTKRFGFEVVATNTMRTILLGHIADPAQPSQTLDAIRPFSNATAQTLPALIGISRTPGTTLVVGVLRDCQGREVSNFIATVSATSGTADHLERADTYYFSSTVGLPLRHSQRAAASEDGQFMVIELAPVTTGFIQVWGFRDDAELAADQLTLVAELAIPLFADTLVGAELAPLRQ